jgi:hypothetical protein
MTTEKIKGILHGLGYKLTDFGDHWRSSAVYRGGSNESALKIYKNSGAWVDYVSSSESFRPLKSLVQLTLQTNDPSEVKKILGGYDFELPTPELQDKNTKLDLEKIYPESLLSNLLPHYRFYENKGLTADTLEFFKGGLATQGAMYQRFVFPIYNSSLQIHGFSGRDMSQNNPSRPKWKHMGKKSTWIYPYYVPCDNSQHPVSAAIYDARSVILVESIGDLLNLHQQGIKNVLVSFGTSISQSLICFLVSLPLDRIVISFNNDSDKDKNRGQIGALKTYLKLLNYFDKDKLIVHLPTKCDFGDMIPEDFSVWLKSLDSLDVDSSSADWHQTILKLIECKDISSSLYKKKYFS